jgi:transposase
MMSELRFLMPLWKQRNKHIQRALVEAVKLAPRQNHEWL